MDACGHPRRDTPCAYMYMHACVCVFHAEFLVLFQLPLLIDMRRILCRRTTSFHPLVPMHAAQKCMCGVLDVSESVSDVLIDSQVKHSVAASTQFFWPAGGEHAFSDPANVYDPCLSFEVSYNTVMCVALALDVYNSDAVSDSVLRTWV